MFVFILFDCLGSIEIIESNFGNYFFVIYNFKIHSLTTDFTLFVILLKKKKKKKLLMKRHYTDVFACPIECF